MATSAADRRKAGRHYLGRASAFGHTVRMFQTREAIEVDEVEGYDVTRRRVFYDDVLLVTYHQFVGWGFVVATAVLTLVFGLLAAAIGGLGDWKAGLILFSFTGLPFLLALIVRLVLKVDAVTVYGRRTRAQIHFALRKGRARTVFNQICRAVKETQDRIAREMAPRAPRPSPLPPPAAPPAVLPPS
jgi:hypothetical protein